MHYQERFAVESPTLVALEAFQGYGRAVIDSNILAGTFYFEYYLVVGGRAEVAVLVDYFCCEIAQVLAVG